MSTTYSMTRLLIYATTSAVTYSPYFKQESSGTNTIYFGHSSNNNSNWGNQLLSTTLIEIKV